MMGGGELGADLSKFPAGKEVSKNVCFRGDTDQNEGETVVETEAEDLVEQGLCEGVARVAAVKAKLDILVVDVDHEVRSPRLPDVGEESSDAVQNGQGLEEPDVLLTVLTGYIAVKTGGQRGGGAQVATKDAEGGVGPHVDRHKRGAQQDRRAAPQGKEVTPPAEFSLSQVGEA